jgi:hypothetical protein
MSVLQPLTRRVLPWGLLAGLLITNLSSTVWQWEKILPPDCGHTVASNTAPSKPYSLSQGGCQTFEEGLPVRFLTTPPTIFAASPSSPARDAIVWSHLDIDPVGFAADWLIWSLVSCLILYRVAVQREEDRARGSS